MNIQSLKQQLLQSDSAETTAIFNEFLRGSARLALFDLMRQEVAELCGPSHSRETSMENRRAGNGTGVCYIDGGKESIRRPRVRRALQDGSEEGIPRDGVLLISYQPSIDHSS